MALLARGANAYGDRPYVIAVAGGSASGKTHNARLIVRALGPERATLVSADDYYAPERQPCAHYLDGRINYDHPSAVDLDKLASHLAYLKAGFPVRVREYGYGQSRAERWIDHAPAEFIVVEGIFALDRRIAELANFRVFVDVDAATRLGRRLRRDLGERGQNELEVRRYFDRVVEPMHARYVQPTALRADQIIESPDGEGHVAIIVQTVTDQARKMRGVKAGILRRTFDDVVRSIHAADPRRFEIVDVDALSASQPEIGFFRLAQKSAALDQLVRHAALAPEDGALARFLAANPIPTVFDRGHRVVVDHHHLLLALHQKGIRHVLAVRVPLSSIGRERRRWVRAQKTRLPIPELVNNPYRSLASLVQEAGFVAKTGRFHEEFEWADYLRARFDAEGAPVDEDQLLDPEARGRIVGSATRFAREPAAAALPGYRP